MKKKFKYLILSSVMAVCLLFGVLFIVPQRSYSANAEPISPSNYDIDDYQWANYFNPSGLITTDTTNLFRDIDFDDDGHFVYSITYAYDSYGSVSIGNTGSLLSDISVSDNYTMSFSISVEYINLVSSYEISKIFINGYNSNNEVTTIASFTVNGFNDRYYATSYIDYSKLYNATGTAGSIGIAFLNSNGSVVNMPAGASIYISDIMLTKGSYNYDYSPYFYSIDEEDFPLYDVPPPEDSSSEDSSSEDSSSEDSSSSDDSSSDDSSSDDSSSDDSSSDNNNSGDYQAGYIQGLGSARYGIFWNAQFAYRVLDSTGSNVIMPYQFAPFVNSIYINNGLNLTALYQFLYNNYGGNNYQYDIMIVFDEEVAVSDLTIYAAGSSAFLSNNAVFLGFIDSTSQQIGVPRFEFEFPAYFSALGNDGTFKLTFTENWQSAAVETSVVGALTNWRVQNLDLLKNVVLYDYGVEYQAGYNNGYYDASKALDSAVQQGYDRGYLTGIDIGYDRGYVEGLRFGTESTSLNDSIKTFVFSVFEAPFQVLESFFSLDFVGFDLSGAIKVIISLVIVAFVISKVV